MMRLIKLLYRWLIHDDLKHHELVDLMNVIDSIKIELYFYGVVLIILLLYFILL